MSLTTSRELIDSRELKLKEHAWFWKLSEDTGNTWKSNLQKKPTKP